MEPWNRRGARPPCNKSHVRHFYIFHTFAERTFTMNRSSTFDALAEIRSRPAYHLACIWLENNARPDGGPRLAEKRIDLYWLARVLGEFTGAAFADDTLMVALTDRGYDVINTRRGLRVNMDEQPVVDALGQRLSRSLGAHSDPHQKH